MDNKSRRSSTLPESIAIVGSGCRFPGGANSPSSLWKLLETTPDLCKEIPPERFNATGFYHQDGTRHGTSNVRHSYFLEEDIRLFDTGFFNINANEADSMDPQQRILLETVYEALEAGGHAMEKLRGSDTSVYVGTMTLDYLDTLTRDHNTIPKYFATGINRAIISNRVSYFFDWHGPSMTIDTACSSSLIAVHQGVQSLRSGESRISVACGTQMLLGYDMYIGESNLRMLSPNGRSRMWDVDADGYARGEGVAAVVLKRLSDAIADGDHIECIIRETGTNQDGYSNGLTVPNSDAQAALMRQTYQRAGLDPEHNPADRPQYFEAHGTGTQVGDPKEAAAIHDVFGRHMESSENPLFVGSIKTVIGHLEGGAGIAGVLKASASLQHGSIPANLSFQRLNPKIEPFYQNLKVPTHLTPWPTLPEGVPRRASVNSFGFGGANAHAIIESYTTSPILTAPSEINLCPYVFSASTETSLVSLLQQYSQSLRHSPAFSESDLAWTLHSRRSQLSTKVAFPASSIEELASKIDSKLASAKDTPIGIRSSGRNAAPRVLGVFTGQGAQWPSMGASLIRSSKFVSDIVQNLEDSLSSLPVDHRPTWSLREEMLAEAGKSRIAEAALSQPLCTALQVILVDLLRQAGIECSSVVGHSSGEIGAAYAAGILSAHDAIRVAYYRGFYAKFAGNEASGQKGAMLAAGLSFAEAHELVSLEVFKDRLAIAAHNSSSSVTISGDADAVNEAKAMLDKDKKFARLLKVDTAYHSHHMIPCGDRYVDALQACGVTINPASTCSWYSSVTPSEQPVQSNSALKYTYWRDNMANTVLFADAVGNAISNDDQINIVLEIGPHPALKGPALQTIGDKRSESPPYFGVLSRGQDDITAFSDALGALWTRFGSQSIDLNAFDQSVSRLATSRKVVTGLPSYQWDHGKAHWSESRRSKKIRSRHNHVHELLGVVSPESNSNDMRWLNVLNASEIPWLEGHRLQGMVVFPAAGYITMATEACRVIAGTDEIKLLEINDFSIPKAVTLDEGDAANVETLVTLTGITRHSDQTLTASFAVYAGAAPGSGSVHDLELAASASLSMSLGSPESSVLPVLDATDDYNMVDIDSEQAYTAFSKLGYGYTGAFKSLSSIRRRLNRASALVSTHAYSDDESTVYWVHPGMLDVAFQAAMLAYASPGDGRLWSLHVPTGISSIRINPQACTSLPISGSQVPVTAVCEDADGFVASIDILSENGQQCMIQVSELTLQPFAPATVDEDRYMYSTTRLGLVEPDASAFSPQGDFTDPESALATTVNQITYRYPHARILEIGDESMASLMVFDSLETYGGALPSYTCTRVSVEEVKAAEERFKNSNIEYKAFDPAQTPDSQGFQPQSYDVVIASNASRSPATVATFLQNVRQLLQPGGYLVLVEQADGKAMRAGAWHSSTREAGFGGVDTMTRQTLESTYSVMVAQAVDEQVSFLRRPLAVPTTPIFIDRLVILCSGSIDSYRMADEVADHLRRFSSEVTIVEGLRSEELISQSNVPSTYINLTDLEQPIFKAITDADMRGLKQMFSNARQILWLTQGAHEGIEPYHAASMAFCRSLANEATHISLNTLDLSGDSAIFPRVIAEQLLRQYALDKWADDSITWSQEPETFLQNGKLYLQRILPQMRLNDRLNSSRRDIRSMVSVADSGLAIVPDAATEQPRLIAGGISSGSNEADFQSQLVVSASSLDAVKVASDTFMHLAVGKKDGSTSLTIGLTTTNSSTASTYASLPASDLDSRSIDQAQFLSIMASEMLAAAILREVPAQSRLLVHCQTHSRAFVAAIWRQAVSKSVMIHFSCEKVKGANLDPSWFAFGQYTSKHALRRDLGPLNITHFLDWTSPSSKSSNIGHNIAAILSPGCKNIQPASISKAAATTSPGDTPLSRELQSTLEAVYESALDAYDPSSQTSENDILDLEDIHNHKHSRGGSIVVRWPTSGLVAADVRALDASHMFSQDKSYILFGLTGQIGQSLCEWMISNGAGCVILTSRKPNVDQRWLNSLEASQGIVKVMGVDITDQSSLANFVRAIRSSELPVGGIVNGANVLSDAPFDRMSAELMNRALRPKITGSYNLDQAFYDDDLDFFVLCSSISCVIGTAGQSNYVAANGYMNGLAKQRRNRGLAASALDLGLILGVGVAEVAGQSVVDSLQKYGITPLSEMDIRSAFAESIQGGRICKSNQQPSNAVGAVLTSGLRTITTEERNMVWYNNPIFSHLVVKSGDDEVDDSSRGKGANLPAKDQIAATSTLEEALEVLRECASNKMRVLLGSGDGEFPSDAPLVEMGIDSLIAVEVRSWFLKSLQIDIPVLKILDGSSLDNICELAMKRLPAELAAQIGKTDISVPSVAVPQVAPVTASSSTTASTPRSTFLDDVSARANGSITGTPTTALTRDTSMTSLPGALTKKPQADAVVVKRHPISIGQSRFWFLQLLVEDPTTFNVALRFHINGHVRVGDLERAVNVVAARHEGLRTTFTEDTEEADQAWQNVMGRSSIKLERKLVATEEEVDIEYQNLRMHQFDLASGPLLRIMLVTISPTSHFLLVNYHHIIMDMASFQVFTAEVDKVYNGQPLGPLSRQYPDFSVEQRRLLDDGELADEIEYWRKIFPAGSQPPVLPLLQMARSGSRTAMSNYAVHQVSTILDTELVSQVKAISRAQRSTPFHFYLAAFKAMLFAFTDVEDLTIGIADANRHDSDVMGSIGFFLNLLTLRFARDNQQSFADAVVEARKTAFGALAHSRLPFDVLLKELNVPRSSSYSPFFQTFFDYRQQTSDRQTWCNCRFELDELHPGRTAYDVALDVADLGSNVHLTFRVQKALYDETAASLILETYAHFVTTFAQDASVLVSEIPRFSAKQLEHGLTVGLGPEMVREWPATLPHRIDEIAKLHGNSNALEDGHGNTYTYTTMIQRVEAIAEALSSAGVGSGSRVLVFQQATSDWICSLLAVMRIGGVYVPLDLRNPMERLVAQAGHCAPAAVLADKHTIKDAPQLNILVLLDVSVIPTTAKTTVENKASPEEPAAILYTSGSTGTPKGIVIKHSGICNEMEGYTKQYQLGAERVLQQSAFTFDFSMDQIFTGLVNGGTVYVVPWDKRGDPLSITEIMWKHSITYTKVTPSEYSMWMQYGHDNLVKAQNWRCAFGGGEPLTKAILRQFSGLGLPNLRLSNSYGPAETSIASHKGWIDYRQEGLTTGQSEDKAIPCGVSLPNYATYVLDEQQKPLPIGMPGEIVIGGAGVSLGYLTDPKLTSRVFMDNPYANRFLTSNGWTQMHRTGDVGHLQSDGSLVFRNRMAGDTQIKLRGLRINLQDIEQNMVSTAAGILKEAIVSLRSGDPEFLVAHVVFSAEGAATVTDSAVFLEQLLGRLPIPQYMMPVMAIPLERLPLTKHSKVDRKAIAALDLPQRVRRDNEDQEDGADSTQTMRQLQLIWEDLLPHLRSTSLKLTAKTDFFQIGGNSLLVVRLQSRIRQTFNVAVRLVDFMNMSTLGDMARKIEDSPVVNNIDWEAETAPPSISKSSKRSAVLKTAKMGKTVVVTGATGNLAKHVLNVLLADPKIDTVHCIAVRDKERSNNPFSHPKVKLSFGDLSLPRLGLSEEEFDNLAQTADLVLHLGALRSFWDNYNMLRPTNVGATKEIVRLAAVKHIPIHFVSTSAILSEVERQPTTEPSSANSHIPAVDGSDGYVSSKWASERVLERSATNPDIAVPSYIYRLLPQSDTSSTSGKNVVLEEFARCMKLAGAVPDTTGWEGRMDLVSGQDAGSWICDSITNSLADKTGGIKYVHHQCPTTVEVEDLREVARQFEETREQEGSPISVIPLLKWMGRIKALGFTYVLASQDATVRRSTGEVEATRR